MRPSLKRPGWWVSASRNYVAPGRVFWLLQCAGWGSLAAIYLGRSIAVEDLRSSLIEASGVALSGLMVTLIWREALRAIRTHFARPVSFCIALGAGVVGGGFLWNALNCWALVPFSRTVDVSLDAQSLLGETWIRATVLLAWSLLYISIKAWADLELTRERAVRAELAAQTARLRALQSQLQPHFIFNSLNAISTLVGDGRSTEARSAISLLGDFLRRTITMRDTPEISVAEELEFVRLYLELVELRFGDRLQSRIDADPETLSLLMPCLLLQPLVENAVRHGLLPRDSVGTIEIRVAATPSGVMVSVEDDGIGLQRKPGFSGGIGLSNTATRLGDLYGSDAALTVEPRTGGGVRVEILLPRRMTQPSRLDLATCEEAL
ncbi:MAG TPA: histidine kinase [Steroidobacteraceae bacterium]|nr:histidine kinase [Steroidobacteraceae bacterium]